MKPHGRLAIVAFCFIGITTLAQSSLASTFTILSNFPARGLDVPIGSLARQGGVLFGVCYYGGKTGYGGVFKILLKNGKEATIHGFSGKPDGEEPLGSLTAAGSLLYGTTGEGGENNSGTIYSVDPVTDVYETLYSFPAGLGDEVYPSSALTPYGSSLIGPTYFGGGGSGSLYQFDPATGKVVTLYAFKNRNQDGMRPSGMPLVVGQKVYGVTVAGGVAGEGTLYEFDFTTGREKPLFSFGGSVGYEPSSNLVEVEEALYGVTFGATGNGPPDYGTFYRYDLKAGTASLVHAFNGQAGTDGANPNSGLIYANGLIYGTTYTGGTANGGTIYTIDPATGTETTLYSFTNGMDGGGPSGGLLQSHGSFYGTTTTGGANGTGTVFSFTP